MTSPRCFILIVCLASLSGCVTEKGAKELGMQFREAFSPFADLQRGLSGGQELAYAIAAFHRKNERWPNDYEELSAFVQASDGLLVLGQYDEVDFMPSEDGGLQVFFLREDQTNRTKITFPAPKK